MLQEKRKNSISNKYKTILKIISNTHFQNIKIYSQTYFGSSPSQLIFVTVHFDITLQQPFHSLSATKMLTFTVFRKLSDICKSCNNNSNLMFSSWLAAHWRTACVILLLKFLTVKYSSLNKAASDFNLHSRYDILKGRLFCSFLIRKYLVK